MERSVMDITLELACSYSCAQATVKRGDTHRSLRIHLTDGGRPYPLDGTCNAIFTAVKPDGSHLYNACRVEDAVVYDLTPQTTAIPGQLECELRLYGKDGALLTSAAFVLTVADTVYADGDENIASTGEATALTRLVSDATEKLTQMEAALKNEVDHATIDDAKVGADAWSSKNIVDKLCPAFTESGSVVTCTPLEGYPLEVVSVVSGQAEVTLTQCGKNLFDFQQGVDTVTFTGADGTEKTYYGYAIRLPAGTYTFHAEALTSGPHYIYGAVNDAAGAYKVTTKLAQGPEVFTQTLTLEEGDIVYYYDGYKRTIADADKMFASFNVQAEAGSVATDYEPYRGQVFTADASGVEGSYAWPAIAALPGTNYLYSDSGNTTVTGRKDIITLLQKL